MANVLVITEYEENAAKNLQNIINNLPADWKKYFVSSTGDIGEYIYDDPVFSTKLTEDEIIAEERWLEYPFRMLFNASYPRPSESKKKEAYEIMAKLVRFWRKYLTENKIDLCISWLEGNYHYTTLHRACRKMNIKFIYLAMSRLGGGGVVLVDSFMRPMYWNPVPKNEIERYFAEANLPKRDKPINIGLKKRGGDFNLTVLLDHTKKFLPYLGFYSSRKTPAEKLIHRNPLLVVRRRLVKEIRRVFSMLAYQKPDYSKKYFLYPLPFHEEALHSYIYGAINEFELIFQISRLLPSDCYLYLKAHPHLSGTDIPVYFSRAIGRFKNIKLLHHKTGMKELMENCLGVITVTSTPGFEALAYGKPVIVFGEPPYAYKNSVIYAKNIFELPQIMEKIAKGEDCGLNKDDQKAMLANYYRHQITISGYPDLFGDKLFSKEEYKELAGAIVDCYGSM